jgi:hypothetical protein
MRRRTLEQVMPEEEHHRVGRCGENLGVLRRIGRDLNPAWLLAKASPPHHREGLAQALTRAFEKLEPASTPNMTKQN